MKKLNYAIIGCGSAGKVHAYHFSRHPSIKCCAAIDTEKKNTEWFREHFGFERCYVNLREALDNESIDVVSIATPPVFHAAQIAEVAANGIHILSEKPLFLNPDETSSALDICLKNEIQLGVMLPRRFYNNSRAVREVLERGELGTIQSVKFDLQCRKERAYYDCWRGKKTFVGGGVLMSQAIHSIDQLVYLFGKPECVEGKVWKTRDYIDVEDEAEGVIRFASGVMAEIRATNNSSDYEWRGITEIEGTLGSIVLDSERVARWNVMGISCPNQEEREDVPEIYKPGYYGPGHRKVILNFIDSVLEGTQVYASGYDAMAALEIIWGVYESSQSGELVEL